MEDTYYLIRTTSKDSNLLHKLRGSSKKVALGTSTISLRKAYYQHISQAILFPINEFEHYTRICIQSNLGLHQLKMLLSQIPLYIIGIEPLLESEWNQAMKLPIVMRRRNPSNRKK